MYNKEFVDKLRKKAMSGVGLLKSEIRAFISGDPRDLETRTVPVVIPQAAKRSEPANAELKRAADAVRQGIAADEELAEMKRVRQRISLWS
jgi:hypothetical protein